MTTVDVGCFGIRISRTPRSAEASHGSIFQTADLTTDIKTKVILIGIGSVLIALGSRILAMSSSTLKRCFMFREVNPSEAPIKHSPA
jgi:hypothetical protein